MSAIVCYSTCWACKFGSCYDKPTPHTWMDDEDAEWVGLSFDAKALAVSHPCACRCGGGKGGCQTVGGER